MHAERPRTNMYELDARMNFLIYGMQICVLSMNINENLVNTATCVLQPASLSPLGDLIRQVSLYIIWVSLCPSTSTKMSKQSEGSIKCGRQKIYRPTGNQACKTLTSSTKWLPILTRLSISEQKASFAASC